MMNPRTTTLALLAALALPAAADSAGIEGLLSFSNGDQLHGRYLGITPEARLTWKRDDLDVDPSFDLSKLRRVILRGGQPGGALNTISHAALINGDRIPGDIVTLDAETAVIQTEFAGTLAIPRAHLGMLAPNPFGGRLAYQGPFNNDGWELIEPSNIETTESPQAEQDADADEDENTTDDAEGWIHSGASWYWPGKGGPTALIRRGDMSERSILRCHLSWKSRVSLAIAFHADFKRIPVDDAEDADKEDGERQQALVRRFHPGDTSIYPELFGNSYVIQLNPTHAMMFRSTINDEGVPQVERLQTNHSNVRLGESGSAIVEIRASRTSGEIALYIDDEFVAQWSEGANLNQDNPEEAYAGGGDGFGFLMQSTTSAARITDIIVAEWNGMPDAARSLQTDEHDIVLLSNGTDRFSGTITNIADGKVSLRGRYGDFRFPVGEVAEIRFARNTLASPEEPAAGQIRLRVHPLGILSGVPTSGDASSLGLLTPYCGEIKVDLSPVVLMEMHSGHSFLDAWDPEF